MKIDSINSIIKNTVQKLPLQIIEKLSANHSVRKTRGKMLNPLLRNVVK